ncbi:MAG: hypothetical protein HWD85_06230 [Flavobacteriaceae bacterium]|nr:hypothetical protein [Flavobacteriaceae bacterium]
MISYKIDREGNKIDLHYIEKLINQHKSTWLNKAAERTAKYKIAGKVTDNSHIWSEIKEVFMKIQGNKCAFCEGELEGKTSGKGVHDVEHFRPKNRITKWQSSPEFNALGIAITEPTVSKGYHLLTYNLLNYSIACGPCNQAIKKDRFPIKGNYNTLMENPSIESDAEIPLLLYPIGQHDVNCEDLISFNGAVPTVVIPDGLPFERAITTIEFFRLGRADIRGKLFKERCMKIITIDGILDENDDPSDYDNILENIIADYSDHASCGRSYVKLLKTNKSKASEVLSEAKRFIRTYIPDEQLN